MDQYWEYHRWIHRLGSGRQPCISILILCMACHEHWDLRVFRLAWSLVDHNPCDGHPVVHKKALGLCRDRFGGMCKRCDMDEFFRL